MIWRSIIFLKFNNENEKRIIDIEVNILFETPFIILDKMVSYLDLR